MRLRGSDPAWHAVDVARTYIAFDPRSGRREVVVEVRPDLEDGVTEEDLERFERRLYERRIHAGLLITPKMTYFVRDTLASLEFSTASYELKELPTSTLLSRIYPDQVAVGEGLYAQVKTWLEGVAGSWSTFVPGEALPMMLPEMVGGLAQAHFDEWDDVLDAE